MEVNGSTLRTSVFMTPEPSILGPSPPLVMQSPHSDQLQAVSRSRTEKTAANRNMTQSSKSVPRVCFKGVFQGCSKGVAIELTWHSATAMRHRLVGDEFLFDGARAGNSRLEFRRADVRDVSGA